MPTEQPCGTRCRAGHAWHGQPGPRRQSTAAEQLTANASFPLLLLLLLLFLISDRMPSPLPLPPTLSSPDPVPKPILTSFRTLFRSSSRFCSFSRIRASYRAAATCVSTRVGVGPAFLLPIPAPSSSIEAAAAAVAASVWSPVLPPWDACRRSCHGDGGTVDALSSPAAASPGVVWPRLVPRRHRKKGKRFPFCPFSPVPSLTLLP